MFFFPNNNLIIRRYLLNPSGPEAWIVMELHAMASAENLTGCFWMFLVGARFFEAQNLDLTWSPYNSAEYLSGQQVMGVQDGHRHAWEPTCLRWIDEARIPVLLDPKRGQVDAEGIYHRRVKLQHLQHLIPAKRCNDYNHINNWIITIGASGSGHCN